MKKKTEQYEGMRYEDVPLKERQRWLKLATEQTEHNNRLLRDVWTGKRPKDVLKYEDEGGLLKRVGWPYGYRPELAKSVVAHERLFGIVVPRTKAIRSGRGLPDGKKRIKILVPSNPKRGEAAKRFALYRDGMTVAEALTAGVLPADIRWDLSRQFIALE